MIGKKVNFQIITIIIINFVIEKVNGIERQVDYLYSPFYLSSYTLNSTEGIPFIIKVAKQAQLVYVSSGFGGFIVLDEIGQNKMLQQQIKDQFINSFDVTNDGLTLVIGYESMLEIYSYPLEAIDINSMEQYILVKQLQFPSSILSLALLDQYKIFFAVGIDGYVGAYDIKNPMNCNLITQIKTDSVQVTSVFISSNTQWIYLSCDYAGIIVLRFNFDLIERKEGSLIIAGQGSGYRKAWQVVATNDNKYIYQIQNWFGIYYANNNELLQSSSENYPVNIEFKPYWPLKLINPLTSVLTISEDNNYFFVGVRSIGILVFDITEKENIIFFQHIQVDGLSNSAALSFQENYLYYCNSETVFTFQKQKANLNNQFPNLFNVHQGIQKEMDGIYKWRCYVDETNSYLMGAFDYSGVYFIPFFYNPLKLQLEYATHLDIEADSLSIDSKNKLIFIPTQYSQNLVTIFSYSPTQQEPDISLENPKKISLFTFDKVQIAESLIFSKDRMYAILTHQIGIILFDCKNPVLIELIQYFVSPPFLSGEIGVAVITDDNNYIIFAVRNFGYYLIDARNKKELVLSDYLETFGGESLTLSKTTSDYAYLMDGASGFAIIDLTQLPRLSVISRISLIGWTQLGIPVQNDSFMIVSQQDNGMVTLINMIDKYNPSIVSTFRRDKQFAVSICITNDEKYLFIANPQGIITLPLQSNIMIHTKVSEILISQLSGFQKVENYPADQLTQQYIFQVGQKIQLNFVILYPISEEMRISKVNIYQNNQVQELPNNFSYDFYSQTLVMEIDKSTLGEERVSQNLNIILIKTVIPLTNESFQYSIEDKYDIVTTDSVQSSQILQYLLDNNIIDSKMSVTEIYDSTKIFKFSSQFISEFQHTIQNNDIQLFIQQLQEKVRQTLILSSYINPVYFYTQPSLSLNFNQNTEYVQSLSTSLISVYLTVEKESGIFIQKDYSGVITSTSESGDQIKLEGSLANINRVLSQRIIFSSNKINTLNSNIVQITIIDNINYPLVLEKPLLQCPFIIEKQQIIIQQPLQQQINKFFQGSVVNIESDLTISFQSSSFFVSDVTKITYKIFVKKSTTDMGYFEQEVYEELSPQFWLQSQGNSNLNYYGKIPSSYYKTVFKFKITANDTYTSIDDYFILDASGIPFFYIFNLLFNVLGPVIAILGLYQKRFILWNMIFKNKVRFEDEIAVCGEEFCKRIILLDDTLADSKIIISKLIQRVNLRITKNLSSTSSQHQVNNNPQGKQIKILEIQNPNKQIIQNQISLTNLEKYTSPQNLNSNNTNNFTAIPFLNKYTNQLNSIQNENKSPIEMRYLKTSGCLIMKQVIEDILEHQLTKSYSAQTKYQQCDYTLDLKNYNTRIHKAIKGQISRYLLSLDKKSQIVYNFMKSYSLKHLKTKSQFWYVSLVHLDSSQKYYEAGELIIFPELELKYKQIADLLIILKLIPSESSDTVNSFYSLVDIIYKSKANINIFLIKEVLFAEAYGFTEHKKSTFNPSQGESIHLPYHKIKQIIAFKQIQLNTWSHYKRYGVSKNIRLPTWLQLDQKHGVIMLKGTPQHEDIEEVLIRIYDLSDYVVKSFLLKIVENPFLRVQDDYSIPDEDTIFEQNQQKSKLYSNQNTSNQFYQYEENSQDQSPKNQSNNYQGNSISSPNKKDNIDETQSYFKKKYERFSTISQNVSNQINNYDFTCNKNNRNTQENQQTIDNTPEHYKTSELSIFSSEFNEAKLKANQLTDEIIEQKQ